MTPEEIKEKHPNTQIFQLTAEQLPEPLFVRKPTRTDVKRYMTESQKNPGLAISNFTLACLVYPEREAYLQMLEEMPMLESILFIKLNALAGGEMELLEKKL